VHVMVMVMVMVMPVMMMMVVMHWLGHRSGGGGSSRRGVLRHCVAGEAKRKHGRGREGLDHGRSFLSLANPNGSQRPIEVAA
jgi:hypothetical protein